MRVSTVSGPTSDAEHTEEAKGTEVNFSVKNKFKSSFYCFSALHVQPVTTAVTFLFLPRADATVSFSGKGIGKGTFVNVVGEKQLYMSADNHAHCGTTAPHVITHDENKQNLKISKNQKF